MYELIVLGDLIFERSTLISASFAPEVKYTNGSKDAAHAEVVVKISDTSFHVHKYTGKVAETLWKELQAWAKAKTNSGSGLYSS